MPEIEPIKSRSRTDRIIDAVEAKLQETGENIAHLARFLGKGYSQTYDWVKRRDGIPNGETLAAMAEYAGLLPTPRPKRTQPKPRK